MGQTIKEIKARLADLTDLSAKEFLEFETDERAGVQAALKSRKKQILAECAEDE
ncbi:ribonuclease HII, partial [Xanthomonas citri pv. citri]|nr:ribonuclease HII [Xanthomonas citri pv. citri]